MMKIPWAIVAVVMAVYSLGCGDNKHISQPENAIIDASPPAALEVIGRWASNFGSTEEISADLWGTAAVIKYDNDDNFAITQNPPDDPFNPGKFSKVVWTEITGEQFYYCIVDFGKDTAEEAENTTKVADDSDPEDGGCGGFSWTRLTVAIEIHGTWESNFGGTEEISSFAWNTMTVIKYANTENFTITQNPSDDQFNPDKFNKIVWTEPGTDQSFFYCFVDFGRDTAEDAENTANMADDSDPANGGCGGFAWTKLSLPQ